MIFFCNKIKGILLLLSIIFICKMKWRIRVVKHLAQGYKAEKLLSWNFNPEDPISILPISPLNSISSIKLHQWYQRKTLTLSSLLIFKKNQIRWCFRYKKGKKKNKTGVLLLPVLQSGCTNVQITLKGYKSFQASSLQHRTLPDFKNLTIWTAIMIEKYMHFLDYIHI